MTPRVLKRRQVLAHGTTAAGTGAVTFGVAYRHACDVVPLWMVIGASGGRNDIARARGGISQKCPIGQQVASAVGSTQGPIFMVARHFSLSGARAVPARSMKRRQGLDAPCLRPSRTWTRSVDPEKASGHLPQFSSPRPRVKKRTCGSLLQEIYGAGDSRHEEFSGYTKLGGCNRSKSEAWTIGAAAVAPS